MKLIEHFNQIVAINQDGRYEVQIPRNENHPPLLTKINVAKERVDSTVNKLKHKNSYEEFDSILREWERENIIEEVPISNDYLYKGHHLPH